LQDGNNSVTGDVRTALDVFIAGSRRRHRAIATPLFFRSLDPSFALLASRLFFLASAPCPRARYAER
jgi:hypothetical protein